MAALTDSLDLDQVMITVGARVRARGLIAHASDTRYSRAAAFPLRPALGSEPRPPTHKKEASGVPAQVINWHCFLCVARWHIPLILAYPASGTLQLQYCN